MSDDNDIKQAAEFREAIHKEALAKARDAYPDIDFVIDTHPLEDYFTEHWDYPGMWYKIPGVPSGYKSREALIDKIASQTIEKHLRDKVAQPEEPFWQVIAEYPDIVVDYAIVSANEPYCSYESHWDALTKGALQIFGDEWKLNFNVGKINAKVISPHLLFDEADNNAEMNYRKAFLQPPYPISYTDADFERVNAVLFPNGTDELEVFKWTTDWSDYFDEGNEWWGSLCLTIYDASLKRFVVIMASATD